MSSASSPPQGPSGSNPPRKRRGGIFTLKGKPCLVRPDGLPPMILEKRRRGGHLQVIVTPVADGDCDCGRHNKLAG